MKIGTITFHWGTKYGAVFQGLHCKNILKLSCVQEIM